MIRIGIITIAISVISISCNVQAKKQVIESKSDRNMPETNIKVDKKYDKNGNVIQYDSTYSYFYSNAGKYPEMRDSIFNNFRKSFYQKFSFSRDPFFNDLFFEDSLLKYDFYKNDFFINRFRNNMIKMDSLFWKMDSLKNNFYSKQFRAPGPLKVPK